MTQERSSATGYLLAAVAGAIGGALAVAFSTPAFSRMLEQMKSMRDECCKMMERTGEAPGEKAEPCETCAPEASTAPN